jgi:transposase, IS5 family
VDATIIAAPSSTKNASAIRDPEMKQTRNGRNWFFGMKLHFGTSGPDTVDSKSLGSSAQAATREQLAEAVMTIGFSEPRSRED